MVVAGDRSLELKNQLLTTDKSHKSQQYGHGVALAVHHLSARQLPYCRHLTGDTWLQTFGAPLQRPCDQSGHFGHTRNPNTYTANHFTHNTLCVQRTAILHAAIVTCSHSIISQAADIYYNCLESSSVCTCEAKYFH